MSSTSPSRTPAGLDEALTDVAVTVWARKVALELAGAGDSLGLLIVAERSHAEALGFLLALAEVLEALGFYEDGLTADDVVTERLATVADLPWDPARLDTATAITIPATIPSEASWTIAATAAARHR